MAFQLESDDEIKAEINVTPLVDVMLVLLVIFMISAPLMFNGVTLNLPKTKKVSKIQLKSSQIIISINKLKEIYIDDQKVLVSELIPLVRKLMNDKKTQSVFIRADETVPYGVVAKSMAKLKSSGIDSISLITDLEK